MLRKRTFLLPRSHLICQFVKRHLVTLRREQHVLAQWLRQYFCQDHGVHSVQSQLWKLDCMRPFSISCIVCCSQDCSKVTAPTETQRWSGQLSSHTYTEEKQRTAGIHEENQPWTLTGELWILFLQQGAALLCVSQLTLISVVRKLQLHCCGSDWQEEQQDMEMTFDEEETKMKPVDKGSPIFVLKRSGRVVRSLRGGGYILPSLTRPCCFHSAPPELVPWVNKL